MDLFITLLVTVHVLCFDFRRHLYQSVYEYDLPLQITEPHQFEFIQPQADTNSWRESFKSLVSSYTLYVFIWHHLLLMHSDTVIYPIQWLNWQVHLKLLMSYVIYKCVYSLCPKCAMCNLCHLCNWVLFVFPYCTCNLKVCMYRLFNIYKGERVCVCDRVDIYVCVHVWS